MPLDRDTSLGYVTNWIARLLTRVMLQRTGPIGIRIGYMPVLYALGAGSELSQKALVEAADLEQPTMAATLARMERDSFVQRRPDPDDKRSQLYSLTPLALGKVEEVAAMVQLTNADALSDLSPEEQVIFRALQHRVLATLLRLTADLPRTDSGSAGPSR